MDRNRNYVSEENREEEQSRTIKNNQEHRRTLKNTEEDALCYDFLLIEHAFIPSSSHLIVVCMLYRIFIIAYAIAMLVRH